MTDLMKIIDYALECECPLSQDELKNVRDELQFLRDTVRYIGYDYVELSYDKVNMVYLEHIKIAREAYQKCFEGEIYYKEPLDDNF